MSSEPLIPTRDRDQQTLAKSRFDLREVEGKQPSPAELKANVILIGCEDGADGDARDDVGGTGNERDDVGGTGDERRWRQIWLVRWGQCRVVDPCVVILRRGLKPRLLASSAALGLTLGVFPIGGVTIGLCAIAAVLLRSRCHVPTLMLANFVVTPLELGLVVPFMRVGEVVTGGRHFPVSPGALWDVVRGRASHTVLFGIMHAVIGWSIFAPACLALGYAIFLPACHYLIARFGRSTMLQSDDVYVKEENALLSKHADMSIAT